MRKTDQNAICDRCGFKFKASQLRKEWTGLMVCAKDYDPRHPQYFVKGVPDNQKPEWVRPRPADVFLNPGDVTAESL